MTVPLEAILITIWPTYGCASLALEAVGTRTSSSFSLSAKFQVTMKNTRTTNKMSTIGAIKNPKILGSACLRKFIVLDLVAVQHPGTLWPTHLVRSGDDIHNMGGRRFQI